MRENNEYEKICQMPKVDLHLHIDGAIGLDVAYDIIKEDKLDVGCEIKSKEDLKRLLTVEEKSHDLNEFLEKFDIPLMLMQSEKNIIKIVEDLIKRLAKENIIYAELRFAPQLHIQGGVSLEEVVKSALEGVRLGTKECDIKVKLILSMMRHMSDDKNLDVIDVALKYLDRGIGGVDLAGAEAIYKTENFKKLFDYAKKKGVPYTIHAGEADGASSIRSAVDFGASRIGHGLNLYQDEELLKVVKEKAILLEMCPMSNLKTNSCEDITVHPIRKYIDEGINVCLCSDDMTVQGTTLCDDYKAVCDTFALTLSEAARLNQNAVRSSFMDDEDKIKYLRIFEEYTK